MNTTARVYSPTVGQIDRSSLTASRGKSEHVSPVSFQSLILQRRNSRSTVRKKADVVNPVLVMSFRHQLDIDG